ncbi:hypothetical protein Tsubulata_021063 [Turnera subulata]|uniref:Uncharacterized protein n=1 Tax=Turnera subulata TaxID=218843 RepID=A0A9Q0FM64_9ROSI|nr:hypothetical protein Tsubulata_021063 [Turnera subulata]
MGGCCCCSSKAAALDAAPTYYYYPRASDEHVPLSTRGGGGVAVSPAALLVDTNLDTSVPDAYRPPPIPMPFDVVRPETPRRGGGGGQEIRGGKNGAGAAPAADVVNSGSVEGTGGDAAAAAGAREKCGDVKGSDCEVEIDSEFGLGEDLELKKPVEAFVPLEEEDSCPICLEGNPFLPGIAPVG